MEGLVHQTEGSSDTQSFSLCEYYINFSYYNPFLFCLFYYLVHVLAQRCTYAIIRLLEPVCVHVERFTCIIFSVKSESI